MPAVPISYTLNAAIAVFAPVVRSAKGWATRIASVLGVLVAIWSAVGVLFMSDRETEMAPGVPGIVAPGVAAVFGALVAVFGRRAHEEHSQGRWSRVFGA